MIHFWFTVVVKEKMQWFSFFSEYCWKLSEFFLLLFFSIITVLNFFQCYLIESIYLFIFIIIITFFATIIFNLFHSYFNLFLIILLFYKIL